MNFQTLSLYCEVIRSGSFSLGAAAHHISQSAASQAVRQLEIELGATLIDRTKRPFMVTPEGRKFFEACQQMIEQFEKARAEITQQRELVGGVVRVAVIYSVGLQDMGFYTQQFNSSYPQAKIRLSFTTRPSPAPMRRRGANPPTDYWTFSISRFSQALA